MEITQGCLCCLYKPITASTTTNATTNTATKEAINVFYYNLKTPEIPQRPVNVLEKVSEKF